MSIKTANTCLSFRHRKPDPADLCARFRAAVSRYPKMEVATACRMEVFFSDCKTHIDRVIEVLRLIGIPPSSISDCKLVTDRVIEVLRRIGMPPVKVTLDSDMSKLSLMVLQLLLRSELDVDRRCFLMTS
mmetsp:Transcript_7236/g.16059  ORF Transcript_7236/g.16059 Transcript_7236/m.16059 type:complete len:130 (-) Transcript_7236:714-1103(-)